MTAQRDVVLVTVDCWRYDALDEMPRLQEMVQRDGLDRAESICAAPATRGAFAAIFAGQHYPKVYDGFDELRDGIVTLPALLGDEGYVTGSVVGSNPFLSAFRDQFDHFWNDDMGTDSTSGLRQLVRERTSALRHAFNYLACRGRVPASTVVDRATEWYDSQSRPRFLSVHFMDAHVPFLPGLRRATEAGLISLYRAHWRFDRDPERLTESDRATLQECYRLSLQYLDSQIGRLLQFVDDDAVVVLTGDHGEEFDHGAFGHARLYDETVRVPLLTRGIGDVDDGETVRQIDLPPTIASELDCRLPDEWDGTPHDGAHRDAFVLNHSPRLGRIYAGVRTDSRKLVRVADDDTGRVLNREAYDLATDPEEWADEYADGDWSGLERRVESFLDRMGGWRSLLERPPDEADAAVESRLEALGYKT